MRHPFLFLCALAVCAVVPAFGQGAEPCPPVDGFEITAQGVRPSRLHTARVAQLCTADPSKPAQLYQMPAREKLTPQLLAQLPATPLRLTLAKANKANARFVAPIATVMDALQDQMDMPPDTPRNARCLARQDVRLCVLPVRAQDQSPAAFVCQSDRCLATLTFGDQMVAQVTWENDPDIPISTWQDRLTESYNTIDLWLRAPEG